MKTIHGVQIESDEGYLTDACLDELRATKIDPFQANYFLGRDFPKIVNEYISCAKCTVTEAQDSLDNPVNLIEFSTGGWSGAEALIGIMLSHFWIRHYYKSWERGGHHVFEVPCP